MNAPSTMLTRGEQAFAGLLPSLFSWPDQFTPGSRITLRPRLLPSSGREYTPARSADRHRPEAHCRRLSILSPAVTVIVTTSCDRPAAARSEKPPGWRRFLGPRTGDQAPRRPSSRPTPRGAGRGEKCWSMGGERDGDARAKEQPGTAHTLLFPAARVACGGAARGGPGVGPHQPADSFGIASGARWESSWAGKAQNKLITRVPEKIVGLCEAVAVRFWLRDGYFPVGTGVFGFPVRRVASPAEASELRAGRVPRFRFQQPSLSGAIECSHRIESGALPTASP